VFDDGHLFLLTQAQETAEVVSGFVAPHSASPHRHGTDESLIRQQSV
jgi:hypothetical protein